MRSWNLSPIFKCSGACQCNARFIVLQVAVNPISKFVVFRRMADETRVELNRWIRRGRQKINELIGQATAPEKGDWEIS